MVKKWLLLLQIFWTFFKIGPVTFGGGYAMIPMIEREIVIKRKWIKRQDIIDVLTIAESIPGAIAINSATFIGFRMARIPGALAALLGMLMPTFCIIVGLVIIYDRIQSFPKVEAAFEGIRAAIVALIVYAGFRIGKTAIIDKATWLTVTIAVILLFIYHFHPALIILCGVFVGVSISTIKKMLGIKNTFEKESS